MTVTRDDLKRLRMPLAVAIVLRVLGARSPIASGYYLDEASRARDATRQTRVAAQERVLRVAEEEREIRDDLVYYEQMGQRGVVGEQSRLDWIESIARIKNDRKLLELRYNFDAQRPLYYPGLAATRTPDSVASLVKRDMLLLLWGDLL